MFARTSGGGDERESRMGVAREWSLIRRQMTEWEPSGESVIAV